MHNHRPLASLEGRFALGRPKGILADDDPYPSPIGVRPFGLRYMRPFPSAPERMAPMPEYRYCPERQIAILVDCGDAPLFKHSHPITHDTTGQSDGDGPGREETRSDYQPD